MIRIDPRDWPEISALFDQALDVPADERPRWLEALPQARRVHVHTLELLLADHAQVQTKDFLDTLPKVVPRAGPEAANDEPVPVRQVGPYRLLRELGRGGMGSVWLGERVDGSFKQQLALKLPHPGLATRAFAERLERERDILASLAHPHIARLYDAGVTDEGQPYIALAYVQGLTLIDHCRTHGLGVRERVALFQQVLEAVQYAHGHLVIHRDLKPSNVLVDEHGQVHLLDFGIAKLLVDGQAHATALTLDAGQAMTPDYASPEQIAGEPISTASDVYSLGVLLFELLAGARPYRLGGAGGAALHRELSHIDPPRPSAIARAAGARAAARALEGDLDTIVLKALKKVPGERYPTADSFRADLQRHLDGAPVTARPDSMGYRVGKFVRRHRWGVGATALVVLATAAGLAGTAWQAHQATQQAQRAQAVQDFLIGLFDEADPARAKGQALTPLQLLDRGQQQLHSKLADQPRLQLVLNGVLATLYDKLDEDAKALPLAQARRDLALRDYGADSLEYGDALFQLADIQGVLDLQQGQALFGQARQVLARHADVRAGELLTIDWSMAYQLGAMSRFHEAADLLRTVVPKVQAHFGAASWETLHCKALLLYDEAQTGDFADASRLADEIEPLLDAIGPERATDVAIVRNNMARAELQMWNLDKGELLATRARDDFARLLGPDSRQALGMRHTLADLLQARGRYAQAAQAYEAVAADAARVLGPDDPFTQLFDSTSAEALILAGRAEAAEAMARRSLPRQARRSPYSNQAEGAFQNRLALTLIFTGKVAEAAALLDTIAAQARGAGQDHGDEHARTLLYLAGTRLAQGRAAEAEPLAARAAAEFAKTPHGAHMLVARAQLTQALAAARSGDVVRAGALIDQAQAHLQQVVPADHPSHLWLQLVHADVLRSGGQPDRADAMVREARTRLHDEFGALPPTRLDLVF